LAVPLKIDRDEGESRVFYSTGDFFRHVRLEPTGEFVRRQFDSRQLTVRADAKLAEAKFTQSSFGMFHLRKESRCDGDSVRNSRRETR